MNSMLKMFMLLPAFSTFGHNEVCTVHGLHGLSLMAFYFKWSFFCVWKNIQISLYIIFFLIYCLVISENFVFCIISFLSFLFKFVFIW